MPLPPGTFTRSRKNLTKAQNALRLQDKAVSLHAAQESRLQKFTRAAQPSCPPRETVGSFCRAAELPLSLRPSPKPPFWAAQGTVVSWTEVTLGRARHAWPQVPGTQAVRGPFCPVNGHCRVSQGLTSPVLTAEDGSLAGERPPPTWVPSADARVSKPTPRTWTWSALRSRPVRSTLLPARAACPAEVGEWRSLSQESRGSQTE